MSGKNDEKKTNISAVFFSGWGDAQMSLYKEYFGTPLGQRINEYTVKEQKASDLKIGTHSSGQEMTIRIKYFDINGHLVGFWYPISNYFNFDTCKDMMNQTFPNVLQTNDSNIGQVLNVIKTRKRITIENKNIEIVIEKKTDSVIGLVDCGSEFVADVLINEIIGTNRDKSGPYVKYYRPSQMGYYTSLNDVDNTTISIYTQSILKQEYVLVYVSGTSGNATLAKKAIEERYPGVPCMELTAINYETFVNVLL